MDRVTKLCEQAIGKNQDDDYILRPAAHAASIEKSGNARLLVNVLREPKLQEIVERYSRSDKQALRAQGRYKFLAKTAVWLVFLAVITAAIAAALPLDSIFGPDSFFAIEGAQHHARLIAIGFLFFALLGAFSILFWLETRKPYVRWHEARGRAEMARKDLFRAVFAARVIDGPVQGESPLLPLKLEYFRRYLLDDQILYYYKRGGQHASAERRKKILWGLANIGILLMIIATFLVGVVAPLSEQGASPLLHLVPDTVTGYLQRFEVAHIDSYLLAGGIILAGLFGVLLSFSLLDGAKGNAVRFQNSFENLVSLRENGLENARAKALLNDEHSVMHFVDTVMAQISAEHQDWVKIGEAPVINAGAGAHKHNAPPPTPAE